MQHHRIFREATEPVDSEGHPLSQEQATFFKDSKARNKKGQLLVCYHGTPNPGFTEFNPQEAKSQFGNYKFEKYNVNYFTTNLDTARGYTQIGVGDVDDKYKNIYAVYLNIQNPYVVDNSTPAEIKSWQNVRDKRIREIELKAFDQLVKRWAYDDSRISQVEDQLNADLRKFNHGVRRNERHSEYWDLVELDSNKAWGNAHPVMWEYETVDELFDDEERIKELLVGVSDDDEYGEDDYFYTLDYIVGWVLYMNEQEGTSYDGIIVEDILDIGPHGSILGGSTTDIITLKDSNQIKAITNKNPTNSKNINEDVGSMENKRIFMERAPLREARRRRPSFTKIEKTLAQFFNESHIAEKGYDQITSDTYQWYTTGEIPNLAALTHQLASYLAKALLYEESELIIKRGYIGLGKDYDINVTIYKNLDHEDDHITVEVYGVA